jgi:hypothetical protein
MQSGGKADRNLRFLLRKVLKQSDVGNLGRIVLPKVRQPRHRSPSSTPHLHAYRSLVAQLLHASIHPSALHMFSSPG